MTTQELANTRSGQVYGLFDPNGVLRYTGSNKTTLEERMRLFDFKLRTDHTSSPLYRYVHDECAGSFDGWTLRPVARISYDFDLLPDALVDVEDACIVALRRAGHPLLNKNRAKCQDRDRREYMRQWRLQHKGYMSAAGKKHREKRRVAALAAKADQLAQEVAAAEQSA